MLRDEHSGRRPNRRALLRVGAAAGALGVGAGPAARAHNLKEGEFGSPTYSAALAATDGMKGVFQSPHVEASVVAGEHLNHLILVQLRNWLNGFQFSYGMAPEELHTIVAIYASANLLTYNDAVWEKYGFGEKYAITDPATGEPAVRNVFWPSRLGLDASRDPAARDNTYQDTGIEALQQRGAVFLT